jgi:sugar transferase (PEP-CTERM/EpsH1 system associated)
MRILFLSPFVPFPPHDGGRLRIYELIRGLGDRHRLDLLTLTDGSDDHAEAIGELERRGLRVEGVRASESMLATIRRAVLRRRSVYAMRFYSSEFAAVLSARLRAEPYDVVQCEYSFMGLYASASTTATGARWVLDAHNVDFRLYQQLAARSAARRGIAYRLYARREAARRRAEEAMIWSSMDHVLTVSEVDGSFVRELAPATPVTVIPNGVDTSAFPYQPDSAKTSAGAVFIGKMDYRPNAEAVMWFCDEVLPLVLREEPGFKLTIVGANPGSEILALGERKAIHVVGPVPDTRPYLRDATLAVVPLLAGTGTRLKVLEALASGRAVVSTEVGCEGLDVADGEHVLVSNRPDGFAQHVVRLLREPSLRASIANKGRTLVEERYTWSSMIARLESVYGGLERAGT